MYILYKYGILLVAFVILSCSAFCQDISGTWEGNYGRNLLTTQPTKLVVEISLINDSVITGMSHLYYKNNKYEHYFIKGIFRKRDSSFIYREDSTIAVNLGLFASNCLGTYKTKLGFNDSTMRQEGRWRDKEFLGCPSTSVWLEKRLPHIKKDTALTIRSHVDSINPVLPVKIANRETDIQHLIEVAMDEKDSIKIEVYDNGTIDDDFISLYADNKAIITNQRISTDPIVFYVSLNKNNPLSKLRLVAESLGSIPPCTAIMIITTKHKREEVSLSSNFSKNAAVEFFLKE